MRFLPIFVALLLQVSLACGASLLFTATLDGNQEVPAVVTTGSGSATVVLHENQLADLNDDTIDFELTLSNLVGGWQAVHFHGPAAVGQIAGILFDLAAVADATPAALANAGTFTGTNKSVPSALVSALKSGSAYLNVRTTFKPGGEIRGQLIPEPTAGSLSLLVALLCLRRPQR